jgi:UDP-N-acetylmuramoyl-tripeptide--D-alanyl-D-alanine ligase
MTNEGMLASLIGLGVIALTVLAQLELWQRKEYRWDRFRDWLFSTEFIRSLIPFVAIGAILTDAGWILYMNYQEDWANLLGWAGLSAFAAHVGLRTLRRGVLRPEFTVKAITMLAGAVVLIAGYAWFVYLNNTVAALQWATLVLLWPLVFPLIVGLVNIPFALKKRQIIAQAARLRSRLSDLTVIGITGSYGKTSTKYFLQHLLTDAVPEVKATAEHRNSELTVAQDMLAQLGPQTTHYIAEHAAYRRGEVAAVARLTKPDIGILTAIGNQHLSLFGSRQAIAEAKWELITALPDDGVAILNADDEMIQRHAKTLSTKVLWYSITKPADVYISKVEIKPTEIKGTLSVGKTTKAVTIPLASEALLSSVMAALSAAVALRVPLAHLIERLKTLKPYTRTMEIVTAASGATVIDDSYSANEAGVAVALKHLQRFPLRDRRVIMVPLIELGREAAEVHQRLGQALGRSQATVYVYGQAHREALLTGAREADQKATIHFFTDPKALTHAVTQGVTRETVFLLEGRIPDMVRQAVL